jgi:hypothetical protein
VCGPCPRPCRFAASILPVRLAGERGEDKGRVAGLAYRRYCGGIRAIRDRFDQAGSPADKLQVMVEMQRLSFDEFRNFLRSNNEARFVI